MTLATLVMIPMSNWTNCNWNNRKKQTIKIKAIEFDKKEIWDKQTTAQNSHDQFFTHLLPLPPLIIP